MKNFLKSLGKNVLSIIIGGILGVVFFFLYTSYYWLPTQGPEVGLAIIGVFPAVLVILCLFGIITGGLLGFAAYNIYKIIKRLRKS